MTSISTNRSGGRGIRSGAVAAGLALALAASPALAQSQRTKETATDGAVGAAAGLSSVVYGPAKVAYAAGGTVVAGLAWVLSGGDNEVAKPILDASVRGDYVVTPEHVRGERSLEFVGRSREDEALRTGAVSSAPAETSTTAAESAGAGASWQ